MDLGLDVPISTPLPRPTTAQTVITAETGLSLDHRLDLRVEPLVQVGDRVIQGEPVLRDRRRPECVVTAPISGRVAELDMGAGRRLSSFRIYTENDSASFAYDTNAALAELNVGSSVALRELLQACGLWMRFLARPFGRVPAGVSSPGAIFVMVLDTRPLALDPRLSLDGENAALFDHGLQAIELLSSGPVYICQARGEAVTQASERRKVIMLGERHPAGCAGVQIHRLFPASADRSVWEIAAEDVVAIGRVLKEGRLPATRLVSVAGPGLRETRLVRCQPGADLRELTHAHMTPGQRVLLSGSVLDGREARWLGLRDRQVTVLPRSEAKGRLHWLQVALRGASRPEPIIATAAVEHALGAVMPGIALLRALAIGDDESAAELGALSFLEEDMALVDYVTVAAPRFADLLRACLDRIEAEA